MQWILNGDFFVTIFVQNITISGRESIGMKIFKHTYLWINRTIYKQRNYGFQNNIEISFIIASEEFQ